MDNHRIEELYQRYVSRTLRPADVAELRHLVDTDAFREVFGRCIDLDWDMLGIHELPEITDERLADNYTALSQRLVQEPVNLRRLWPRIAVAAASVVALLTIGWWFLDYRQETADNRLNAAAIMPGGNRATLTLGDGRTIDLSEAQAGIIVGDEVTYLDGTEILDNGVSHLMSLTTPKGGTYQITLPDGTIVWLNANSTLKYPSRFSDAARVVELEGEAYFDVRQQTVSDGQRTEKVPFKVQTAGQVVEVLGTEFNISAYADDAETQTTLVEGRVKVSHRMSDASSLLKPREQAKLVNGTLSTRQVNTEPYIAWKNGYFFFEDEPLRSVMGKIAKWYDVEVVFSEAPPADGFNGIISRSKSLDQTLAMLERTKAVRFTFKGNTIQVSRYN